MRRGSARRCVSSSPLLACLASLACVLGAGAWSTAARADDVLARLHLAYEAPPECPSRAALEEQLRARVPEGRSNAADTRRFEIHIAREASGGYAGQLVVLAPERAPDVREIRAPECAAVGTSLVVFLAIALDPSTRDATAPPPPERSAPEAAPAPAPAGEPRAPARPPPRPAREAPAAPPAWTFRGGYQLTFLRAPDPAWGGRVFAEIARVSPSSSFAPAARISYGWSGFSLEPPLAGEATFRLRTARLEACARFAPARSPFALAPCAMLDIGTLAGTAPELPRSGHATTRWAAAGALARGSYAFTHWLSVELEGGLLVPLERTGFALVEPFRFVYRPPALLFEGALGACVSARFY